MSKLPDAKSVPEGAASLLRAFTVNEFPQDPEQIFLTSWGEWWGKDVYDLSLDEKLQDKWCLSKEEIEKDRVCEVLFKKQTTTLNENGIDGFKTTLTYDINSVLKAGPTGSVTKAMLYAQFDKLIKTDQLSKLWVYVTVSDVSTITSLDDSPKLGGPGDFSKDRKYRVTAADGSTKDYLIRTVKGF